MGHSSATYEEGLTGLKAGASGLTHTLNAMPAWASRAPGLAGLISLPEAGNISPPWYTIIADGEHLHPNTVSLLHRSNPKRSILITDSIELASLKDGTYPGHSQIPFEQVKSGTRATIAGTDTLIGGCIPLQQSMRNLMNWSGCGIAEAVGTVTENVAAFMGVDGEGGRGILKEGRRADLTVLSEQGEVLQTWVAGHKVWDKEEDIRAYEDDGEARG
jgi:N-acetylglucosamine-6-phosphate deacetylase